MLPPDDEFEAEQLIRNMEAHYATAFAGFEEDLLFYEGKLDAYLEAPEGFDITIPTTARAVVDEAVDNFAPTDFLITYPPRAMGDRPEKDADLIRKWVHGILNFWRTSSNDIDFIRDFGKNQFMSGKACFKIGINWSLWPQLTAETEAELRASGGHEAVMAAVESIEQMRDESFPFSVQSIPPACIMEDPTVATRKLWIIERYEGVPEEVRATYALEYEPLRDYYARGFLVHEVWTATYVDWKGMVHKGKHWVFINWELIREEDNIYGELPYVIKYSGFGREAYDGKPEYKSVGFYTRQVKSMLLAEARRHMQFDAIMSQVAFPIAFISENVDQKSISFAPGTLNFVSSDVLEHLDKMWLKPPIPDAEYLSSLSAIGNQIERGTVQRVLRGAGVPGTDSAAQLNSIAGQARLRVEPVKVATEQAVSEVMSKIIRFTERVLKKPVSSYTGEGTKLTVGPKQIKGHHRVAVTFQPNEDAIKERKLILANDAISKGGLSRYDAYTFAGFENPWELIERRMADEMMMEPLVKRAMAKKMLEAWGIDVDALEMEERLDEMKKQFALSAAAQSMQMGTPTNGGPQPDQSQDPNPQPPQGGGDPANSMPLPQGAPAGAATGEVQQMMGDINALGSMG